MATSVISRVAGGHHPHLGDVAMHKYVARAVRLGQGPQGSYERLLDALHEPGVERRASTQPRQPPPDLPAISVIWEHRDPRLRGEPTPFDGDFQPEIRHPEPVPQARDGHALLVPPVLDELASTAVKEVL